MLGLVEALSGNDMGAGNTHFLFDYLYLTNTIILNKAVLPGRSLHTRTQTAVK